MSVSFIGWHKWCSLARPSKGQCTISKIFSSLIFSLSIEQNIFFSETCFAYTISEPRFTVWSMALGKVNFCDLVTYFVWWRCFKIRFFWIRFSLEFILGFTMNLWFLFKVTPTNFPAKLRNYIQLPSEISKSTLKLFQ